ncbi:hypothetical protein ABTZ99_17925 [Actinosynnema sp. NPDC002837]
MPLTRPTVQHQHLTTTPLLPARRPLISPTTTDLPPSTANLPRAVPLRWTSGGSAARRPSGSGPDVQRAQAKGDARRHPDPVLPGARPARTGRPAVVRPTPPADPTDTAHQGITHPPVTAPKPPTPPAPQTPPKPVQPAPAIRVTTKPAPVQRVAERTTTPKPTAEPTGPAHPDLDDLARRLLEPVGRLLRAELRHGRERAGLLHDRRR